MQAGCYISHHQSPSHARTHAAHTWEHISRSPAQFHTANLTFLLLRSCPICCICCVRLCDRTPGSARARVPNGGSRQAQRVTPSLAPAAVFKIIVSLGLPPGTSLEEGVRGVQVRSPPARAWGSDGLLVCQSAMKLSVNFY